MFYKIINRKKRLATIAGDLLGSVLWAPVNLLRQRPDISPDSVRDVLVIRTAYIGDVVMTLPILAPLKRLYPKARITFLAPKGAEGLFNGHPYVDSVIAYDAFWFYKGSTGYKDFLKKLTSISFDVVIEARADIRDIALIAWRSRAKRTVSYGVGGGGFLLTDVVPYPGLKHKVEYHLDLARHLGARADDLDWGLSPTEAELKIADGLLGPTGPDKTVLIGMHAVGRKDLKTWAPEGFSDVADRLIELTGGRVFFTGSATDAQYIDRIIAGMKNKGSAKNLAGSTDIRALMAVIKKLDLFITNDSAPLHLASAMNTPTVAIFGPSKAKETGPYGNAHVVVEKDFPCRYSCDEDVCNFKEHQACMKAISANDVYGAARALLGKTAGVRLQ